jgi:predicted amidohydrolase
MNASVATRSAPESPTQFLAGGPQAWPWLAAGFGRISAVICFDADFPQLLSQAGALRADIVLDPIQRLASYRSLAHADGKLPCH